jgi:hypothetical protein
MLLLIGGIIWLWWYPLQVLQAIPKFNWAQGTFVGMTGTSQILAFSLAGGLASLVLMTYWIMKSENFKLKSLPVALAVAYICTIAVTMWYEQLYANLWDMANHTNYWLEYYVNPAKLLQVVIDMSLVFVAYPWMRRANIKLVILLSAVTIASFGAWFEIGFVFPTTSALAYFFNASSRIASQLAMAVTVLNKSPIKQKGLRVPSLESVPARPS